MLPKTLETEGYEYMKSNQIRVITKDKYGPTIHNYPQ